MATIPETFKEAFSHAVAGLGAAEQEAEKVLRRMADTAGIAPEDVRRRAKELGSRLEARRKDLENLIEEGVKSAAHRLKVPTMGDLAALEQRLEQLSTKVEELTKAKEQGP